MLSLHITVYQADNSMTTSEVDWLTLIHSAEVENFSKRISIRRIFPFAHYPFNFSLLLSTFTQNNKNSVTLGSILRTNASGAEQMHETYNLNQIYPR